MYYSPSSEVKTVDPERPYILMDAKKWWWSKVDFKPKFKLQSGKLPTSKEIILLRDFRGGAHGRVWLACSKSGLACVIKFAARNRDVSSETLQELEAKLKGELDNWQV